MFYVHLLPLAVLSLSTAHKGRMSPPADCNQPERFPKDNLDAFVSELNRRRKLMVEGNQQNGPQGNGNLPKGENVREMEWSCNLEKKAIAALNLTCPTECPTQSPNVPDGTTGFFYWYA
ncbi:hypothetical protein ANCCAN_00659 [Ancylostoma caninum]|uniref:SCP domain-containing protein n=1 Tax=Ancylostoma caninum TaxID=29170 RepID=A0A368HBN4_ANCCA|nr:hypothetical protein ANCCAN_00659 [Ancylostoma caninum]